VTVSNHLICAGFIIVVSFRALVGLGSTPVLDFIPIAVAAVQLAAAATAGPGCDFILTVVYLHVVLHAGHLQPLLLCRLLLLWLLPDALQLYQWFPSLIVRCPCAEYPTSATDPHSPMSYRAVPFLDMLPVLL